MNRSNVLFVKGNSYSSADIYEVLSVPKEKRGGNWLTGYHEFNGDFYIFANVGTARRTGNDYQNEWRGEQFSWFAKSNTTLNQLQVQNLLNPIGAVYLFTRVNNRDPFTFQGHIKAVEAKDTSPVNITWQLIDKESEPFITNVVQRNRVRLKENHYIRKADPSNSYWFGFDKTRVDEYRNKFNDDFNIILVGDDNSQSDFFVIPYRIISPLLSDEYLTTHGDGRQRWLGDIRNNQLRISKFPYKLDVGNYYGVWSERNSNEQSQQLIEELEPANENDYAIENRRAEISIRLGQSVFRRSVLGNFKNSCCLTGIQESELLVASHIIPWACRIESRLDPANGLCLFSLYDSLFDKGFISFDDDLRVLTTPHVESLSASLAQLLKQINGRQARKPVRHKINADYLAYHRENIFKHVMLK